MSRTHRALLAALLAFAVAAPASAVIFVIHLKSGFSFESRYRPVDVAGDDSKITFVNEHGNLIALDKAEVDRIEADVESLGYGHMLDTTTMALGWAPNDAVEGAERLALMEADNLATGEASTEPIYEPNASPPTISLFGLAGEAPAAGTATPGPPVGTPLFPELQAPPAEAPPAEAPPVD
jgi:hypothetical protein